MDELQQNFPQDIEYRIAYDPTVFVRASLQSVAITLLEALVLVVLVVVMFLQTGGRPLFLWWRFPFRWSAPLP